MRGGISAALGVAAIVAAVAAAGALGGGPVDPNPGDDFVGKEGGLRYSQDGSLASVSGPLAGCGSQKWHLIGGGGAVSGPPNETRMGGMRGWDFGDTNGQPDDGWYATGDGPPGSAVSAAAICRKGGGLRYRAKIVSTGMDGLVTAKLGCGNRRWQVTTGSAFMSPVLSFINSSHPIDGKDRDRVPDDGWRVRVLNGVGAGGTVTVHAICARKANLRYKRGKPVTLGTADVAARMKSRNVSCGKQRHVVGGGGRLSGLINRGRLLASVPNDSGDPGEVPDDRWRATGFNLGGVATTLTPYAICLG